MPPKTKNPTFPLVEQNRLRNQSTPASSSSVRRSLRRDQSPPAPFSSVRRSLRRDQSSHVSSSSVRRAMPQSENARPSEPQRTDSETEETIEPMQRLGFYFNQTEKVTTEAKRKTKTSKHVRSPYTEEKARKRQKKE